jgi:nucleoside-diphosphate-sugar epimerase
VKQPAAYELVSAPKRIGVVGATGFIGSCVVERARSLQHVVVPIQGRLSVLDTPDVDTWRLRHEPEWVALIDQMRGLDAVINAAGSATPDATSIDQLWGQNVVLPLAVASAMEAAGVLRLVHISSAAVQGFRPVLDETLETDPFSPYSSSKAAAEKELSDFQSKSTLEVVIYRPTSVQGNDRATTKALLRRLNFRVIPVLRGPDRPLPLALVENVADLSILLATISDAPKVILHPWEGLTNRKAVELLGGKRGRVVALPAVTAQAIRQLARIPAISGTARRVGLFLTGQGIQSSASEYGYVPRVCFEGYVRLKTQYLETSQKGLRDLTNT